MSGSIESILGQTFSNFEFVLIDDGSTDDTFKVIQEYSRLDPRIVPVSKPNTGLTNSLNIGACLCRGRWIARIDADDLAMPDRLEKQLNHLRKFPDTLLLGTACELIDTAGARIKSYSWPIDHEKLVDQLEMSFSIFPHSSAMFNTLVFNQVGGYNKRFLMSQDCDLWLRFCERGKISCLPEILVKLRKHGQQVSSQNGNVDQINYGMSAIVCHFLRSADGFDPSNDDEATWLIFLKWMQQQLYSDHFLGYQKLRIQMRENYYKFMQAASLSNLLQLARSMMRGKLAVELMLSKFKWSNYPRVLADRWEQYHVNAGLRTQHQESFCNDGTELP